MFGYNRAELIGKPVEVFIFPQRFRGRHADLRCESCWSFASVC